MSEENKVTIDGEEYSFEGLTESVAGFNPVTTNL